MATASDKEGTRTSVMPYVAYGVVLALLFVTGFVVWTMARGVAPGLSVPPAPATEVARTVRALKLPPRAAEPAPAAAPARQELDPPPPASVAEKTPEPSKPEPAKPECKVDLTRWPTDRSDQAKAIQILLRDLGFYRGTTNGTAGPATRTAIREFQLAAGEPETGEVTEVLFEALKKKCAVSAN